MLLNLCQASEGVFKPEFRNQLLTTLSVTLITFCHGIGLGWLSPMLAHLQSPTESPVSFVVSVDEASWIGSSISVGGFMGNLMFGQVLDRIGRKASIYCLALPHICLWVTIYMASSVEYLYLARFFGGLTGGGVFVVLPIFIGEISDSTIRGRLTSTFSLTLNTGVLVGFIISSHVPYHLIPCTVITLPVVYMIMATMFPETPQHLLRRGCDDEAKKSFTFYRNFRDKEASKADHQKFNEDFAELRMAITQQKSQTGDVGIGDFLSKRSMKALCTGIILMIVNIYSGGFAIVNYMSSIFAATKSEIDPNTNTIIIGVVQIVGTYTATILVDRYGRKILMIVSTAGMGLGLAAFGMYAFFAEETDVDLSSLSWWLPLLLVAFIIFLANIGINPVTFVVLIEIMPPKIRSTAASVCLALLSVFAFGLLKMFPIFMHSFGLSATMWFCASVCALGLFYISIFLEETKGKSMDRDE